MRILTTISIVANLAMILIATLWSGAILVIGTIGVMARGVSGPPGSFEYIWSMSAGFFFPALVAGVVIRAHVMGADWRWRWQSVALIVWGIEYGWMVVSFIAEVVLAPGV